MKGGLLFLFIVQFAWSDWNSSQKCPGGKPLFRRGIQQAEVNKIIEKHNQLRNELAKGSVPSQYPAQNMRAMTWDGELARQAQKWADNCKFSHDPNLKNNRGESVGQNLAISYTTNRNQIHSPNIESLVQMWFDEVKKYGYTNNGQFQYGSGHYSQMIWAKSTKIGCGFTSYQRDQRFVALYLVCNYYPAGNFVGQKAYVPGKRNCKAFNLSDSRKYSDLCN